MLTPTLTGAQPALYQAKGKTVCPPGQENDKAFALLDALDETQRKQAILNPYRVADLFFGLGHDGEPIEPGRSEGIGHERKAACDAADLISEWAGIVNDAYVTARMDEIKAGLDDTYFAWSGATTHELGKNGTAYYGFRARNWSSSSRRRDWVGSDHACPHDVS